MQRYTKLTQNKQRINTKCLCSIASSVVVEISLQRKAFIFKFFQSQVPRICHIPRPQENNLGIKSILWKICIKISINLYRLILK